jgi:hypothetical protein
MSAFGRRMEGSAKANAGPLLVPKEQPRTAYFDSRYNVEAHSRAGPGKLSREQKSTAGTPSAFAVRSSRITAGSEASRGSILG